MQPSSPEEEEEEEEEVHDEQSVYALQVVANDPLPKMESRVSVITIPTARLDFIKEKRQRQQQQRRGFLFLLFLNVF